MPRMSRVLFTFALSTFVAASSGCSASGGGPGGAGRVKDEALQAGRLPGSFAFADEDYFHDVDQTAIGLLTLDRTEIQGRNMWWVWTGGDDRLWDVLTWKTYGLFDLVKTLSSNVEPREDRWKDLGVSNEPCLEASDDEYVRQHPELFGLHLDHRKAGCQADPFEDVAKYPGVRAGHRGEVMPVGSFYGYASGVMGLRVFPNPDFGADAKAKWDPVRFYNDPTYYQDRNLVRPFRVGMACGFCHIGPSPIKPPQDPANPKFENLSGTVGAQYFWFDRVFDWNWKSPTQKQNFLYQALKSNLPGALDTSLVSTDYINNPRTMNAVYQVVPRLELARRWGLETLAPGGSGNNAQFNTLAGYGVTPPFPLFFNTPNQVWSPRVLKDGADSVGVLGALNRVYLNIGLFSEEWLWHFNAVFGGKKTTPIEISVSRQNSSYWNVTEGWTPAMARYLIAASGPHHLADAPGGMQELNRDDAATVDRGKEVFADRCARCHSSKQPSFVQGVDPAGCAGRNYIECFNKYWAWTKTADYKTQITKIVKDPTFLDGNLLSTELRIPVQLLQTNACSPLASNAIGGSIWDNFSSQTYKELSPAGNVTIYDPYTGDPAPNPLKILDGGRGYTRPASLVSLWSTAPFLLNNSVGPFDPSPSVASRLDVFRKSIRQMLWPEERDKDPLLAGKIKGPSRIIRSNGDGYMVIPHGYLDKELSDVVTRLKPFISWAEDSAGNIRLGPIPDGTPVGLLLSLNLNPRRDERFVDRLRDDAALAKLGQQLKRYFKESGGMSAEERQRRWQSLTAELMNLSACPDYIINRGHYFGTDMLDPSEGEPGLSDPEKQALIAFLKRF